MVQALPEAKQLSFRALLYPKGTNPGSWCDEPDLHLHHLTKPLQQPYYWTGVSVRTELREVWRLGLTAHQLHSRMLTWPSWTLESHSFCSLHTSLLASHRLPGLRGREMCWS